VRRVTENQAVTARSTGTACHSYLSSSEPNCLVAIFLESCMQPVYNGDCGLQYQCHIGRGFVGRAFHLGSKGPRFNTGWCHSLCMRYFCFLIHHWLNQCRHVAATVALLIVFYVLSCVADLYVSLLIALCSNLSAIVMKTSLKKTLKHSSVGTMTFALQESLIVIGNRKHWFQNEDRAILWSNV